MLGVDMGVYPPYWLDGGGMVPGPGGGGAPTIPWGWLKLEVGGPGKADGDKLGTPPMLLGGNPEGGGADPKFCPWLPPMLVGG